MEHFPSKPFQLTATVKTERGLPPWCLYQPGLPWACEEAGIGNAIRSHSWSGNTCSRGQKRSAPRPQVRKEVVIISTRSLSCSRRSREAAGQAATQWPQLCVSSPTGCPQCSGSTSPKNSQTPSDGWLWSKHHVLHEHMALVNNTRKLRVCNGCGETWDSGRQRTFPGCANLISTEHTLSITREKKTC